MRRSTKKQRNRLVETLSQTNRWYEYERQKKHLGPSAKEAQVKGLVRNLRL